MNSRASFWMVGTTLTLISAAWWMQFRQPANSKTPPDARSQVVETRRSSINEHKPALPQMQQATPATGGKPSKKGKPPVQDPAARAALSLVGKDATAELVWTEAINNPNLPKQERSDLIEDLNEDGFLNRKQPTLADLPLIEERLKLIDRLMPESLDQTNLDAFGEARKDLMNMKAKLNP